MQKIKLKSRIKMMAQESGVHTPSDLGRVTQLTYPTCKSLWQGGDISKKEIVTLAIVAKALGCNVSQLYEVISE